MTAIAREKAGIPARPVMARPLLRGDGVAIVSTSSPTSSRQLDTVIAYLTSCGYRPVPMPGVLASFGHLAGDRAQRASDLMEAFTRPDVRLILPANGGIGAGQLVDLLDYEIIRDNPKLFTGVSDPSVLCNSIFARAGLVTVHGPTGFNFFQDPVDPDTAHDFWRMVSGPIAGRTISSPQWRVARNGSEKITGRIVGGNLASFRSLVGTRYMPPLAGAILMLEEYGASWAEIEYDLTHLRLADVFTDIAALIWGVPVECARERAVDRTLDDLILRCLPDGFPVVSGLLIGHASHMIPLPVGGMIQLDIAGQQVRLTFCDDVVA